MSTTHSPSLSIKSESNNTIEHIVLKPSHAYVLQSHGDGFGSYIERLINVAHETHRTFTDLLQTLNDVINYLQEELQRTYSDYQFTIIIGKDFNFDENFSSNPFALVEHTGMKILIFSSIGSSYKYTTTITNNLDDDKKPLSW